MCPLVWALLRFQIGDEVLLKISILVPGDQPVLHNLHASDSPRAVRRVTVSQVSIGRPAPQTQRRLDSPFGAGRAKLEWVILYQCEGLDFTTF